MPIPDLFSKRRKRELGEAPDVYQYDSLPLSFRVQVMHIIDDVLGEEMPGYRNKETVFEYVVGVLVRDYGRLHISSRMDNGSLAFRAFLLGGSTDLEALDAIELFFGVITGYVGDSEYRSRTRARRLTPTEAVDDLNVRFRENGIGYQFESKQLIRLDSNFLHAEAVKPALTVLRGEQFAGANEEFLSAHEDYRNGRNKECLVDCLKAFESTMKSICSARNWTFNQNDNAKTMIGVCISNGLIPSYLESKMSALRSLLESGVPTVRNRNGAHGQGTEPVTVPDYLARYALNLTATTVLFLVEVDSEAD